MHKFVSIYLVLTTLALMLAACSEEEEFTSAANATVSFNVDTVAFDTVISEVASPTERLIVYNRNDKGIRLSNIALKSNGDNGFRINVDGQFGPTVSDVEILAKDSIFIFVEVTGKNKQNEILSHLTDSVIFTLENGLQQTVTLEAFAQKAHFLHHAIITEDTTLDNSMPYVIYDSLVVAENASLTIPAGTSLLFHNKTSLIVHGNLKVEGELGKEVILRGDRTDKLFTYLPYDRLDKQWGGIMLTPSCTGCNISHADIHGGSFGVYCDSIKGELAIENSSIHNVAGSALAVNYSKALVANTQLSNALHNCVLLTHAKADFYHCTLAQFYPWSVERDCALRLIKFTDDKSQWASAESNFYNCFITGIADDEVFAEFEQDKTTLDCHFYSCVINTDISDEKYFTNCTAESKDNKAYRETNFRLINNDDYSYDFRLDSISTAIGKASTEFSILYPTDKNGVARTTPDAGCYQFVPYNDNLK